MDRAISDDVRLFFAVLPPPDERRAIARLGAGLQRAHHLRGRPIGSDRLHLTLAGVQSTSGSLDAVIAHARSIGAQFRHLSFPVQLEWSESFRLRHHSHLLVLRGATGIEALMEFRQKLRTAMLQAGFAVPSGFTPHVTLLWADRAVDAHPITPIQWPVRDFALVLSIAGEARHTHVGRWPLQ
jgi:2'-5' RNA ligase